MFSETKRLRFPSLHGCVQGSKGSGTLPLAFWSVSRLCCARRPRLCSWLQRWATPQLLCHLRQTRREKRTAARPERRPAARPDQLTPADKALCRRAGGQAARKGAGPQRAGLSATLRYPKLRAKQALYAVPF